MILLLGCGEIKLDPPTSSFWGVKPTIRISTSHAQTTRAICQATQCNLQSLALISETTAAHIRTFTSGSLFCRLQGGQLQSQLFQLYRCNCKFPKPALLGHEVCCELIDRRIGLGKLSVDLAQLPYQPHVVAQ
ncbi:hypothetical protein DV451_004814 [Geotrichum candidum]|uniref:Uncharacterized protein n=1 Tax=Geotrichum candidum TaxID=1173061 RepID=A0A9P5G264_GEOCN|nr:hypothetical protein DV451_004814 [Geotrichum candidum]KAF5108144.1 hypothetical protein DV453_002582 [Geotrichum candidum]